MVTMHVSDEQSAAKYSFVDPQELELQPLKGLAPQEENAAPEEVRAGLFLSATSAVKIPR